MSVHSSFVDPEPIVDIQRPIVLRFRGLTLRNLSRFVMHDKRRGGDLSHADPELKDKNEVLFGEQGWIWQLRSEVAAARRSNLKAHVAALRAKSRHKEAGEVELRGMVDPWRASNHGPLREGVLTVSKFWFGGTAYDRWDPNKVLLFRTRAIAFLRENFPDGQLRYASGHVDEEAYHIHFVVATWGEKTTANRGQQFLLQPALNPLIANYERAQDIAGESFVDLGIIRGERRAEAIRMAKAAGEVVPRRRRHIPPSTHRKMAMLESHLEAVRVRRKAEAEARGLISAAKEEAIAIGERAKSLEGRARTRAELTRQDAHSERVAILQEARTLGATVVKKSRAQAIREAKARKAGLAAAEAESKQNLEMLEAQARRAGRAAAEALRQRMEIVAERQRIDVALAQSKQELTDIDRLVVDYEVRAKREAECASAQRLAAEQALSRARQEADAEVARFAAAKAECRKAEASLLRLQGECMGAQSNLQGITVAAEGAEQRMNTAIMAAKAVELGLDLIAAEVLQSVEEEGEQSHLAFGARAPQEPKARLGLLEAVRPAAPMLMRITRMVARMVKSMLIRERRQLAEDATYVMGLRDDWNEGQRLRLSRIAHGGDNEGDARAPSGL